MSEYIMNMETQKLELYFEKEDYVALPDELKKEIKTVKSERVKCFDEKIEGYKKCGSTDKKFDCKKDCLISHNAVLSYIN